MKTNSKKAGDKSKLARLHAQIKDMRDLLRIIGTAYDQYRPGWHTCLVQNAYLCEAARLARKRY